MLNLVGIDLRAVHEEHASFVASHAHAKMSQPGQQLFRPTRKRPAAVIRTCGEVLTGGNRRAYDGLGPCWLFELVNVIDPATRNQVGSGKGSGVTPKHSSLRPIGITKPRKNRSQAARKVGELLGQIAAVAK